ncbi:MAG TPA: cupin domain-containing protein [Bacteroidia bacterium]|nr:cupin domain-containing protein [Bacteroidia bacterium]
MKIITKNQAIKIRKSEGTLVTYFLFDEYEIHYNEQAPDSTQLWHHHKKIWETIYLIEGELTAKWKENSEIKQQIIKAGDLVEVEYTPHTFTNHTNTIVKFLVIKQKLTGNNNKESMKTDKVLDE